MRLQDLTARASLQSGVQNWGNRLVGLIVFVVLARHLHPEEFGVVAAALIVLAIVQLLFDQGFEEAIVQRQSVDAAHLDTTFWLTVALGLAGTLLVALSAPATARWFNMSELREVIWVLAPTVLLSALSKVQLAILRREFRFGTLAARQLASALAGGGVGIGMALSGFGVWSLVGRYLTEAVLAFVLLWAVADWKPGGRISCRHFNDIVGFGSKVLLTNAINAINTRLDGLFIGYILGPTALGIYSVGQRLFQTVMDVLYGVVNPVALTAFSRLQGDHERLRGAFLQAVKIIGFLSCPVFVMLAAFGDRVLPAVFGDQWRTAGPVLQVFAIGGLLFAVGYLNQVVMKAMGRPGWVAALVGVNAVGNLIGYVAASHYGIVAFAAAFVIRGYVVYPLNFRLTQRLINLSLREYLYQLSPSLLASIGATILAMAFRRWTDGLPEPLQLTLIVVVGGGTYVALFSIFWRPFLMSILKVARRAIGRP